MRIDDAQALRLTQVYGVGRRAAGAAPAAEPAGSRSAGPWRADAATFSSAARALLDAQRAARGGGPAVREELVVQLRREIRDGTYRVDEDALARSIAQRLNANDR